jgi:hypothetical protein
VFIFSGEEGIIDAQKQYSKEEAKKNLEEMIKRFPPSKESKELEIIRTFPSGDLEKSDVYLWSPDRVGITDKDEVFVSDIAWRKIFKFDIYGNYLKTISRRGQGPGELMNPICLYVTNKDFAVSDTGNYAIQRFSFDGNLIKYFRIFKAYIEIATLDGRGLIYAVPINSTNNSLLVDILANEGKLINSIIQPRYIGVRWQLANWIKIDLNQRGELIVAFVYFPLILKYSQSGELLEEWKMDLEDMKDTEAHNMKHLSGSTDTAGFRSIICSLRISGSVIYLLRSYPRMQILEIDEKSKKINIYWFGSSTEFRVSDFFIHEWHDNKKFGKEFFVVQKSPESKILVFRPKTNKY